MTLVLLRFNRDIVECKAPVGICLPASFLDLIETLWNVKTAESSFSAPAAPGFNRDIVECKVVLSGGGA